MCGRFGASFHYREIKVLWNLWGDLPGFAPRYNVPPWQDLPVIVCNEDRNEIKPMRWGWVPAVGARSFHWSAHDYRSC